MVPRMHLSLSAPGINHLTLTQFGLKLITVGALTLTITFWWIGTTLHQKIDALKNRTETIITQTRQAVDQAKTRGIDLSDRAIKEIPQKISFVKQVRERIGFSWTQLLSDLESAVPRNLMMSAVSLEEETNTVLLTGSTQSLKDLNRLIQKLEKHKAFHDVILTQHGEKKKKSRSGQPFIVFSMKVSYEPIPSHSKAIKS